MTLENMKMAIRALRINKLRSLLTMLGIIIGIGSVISIVTLGDTMRAAFSDIYKNFGVTMGQLSPSMERLSDSEDTRSTDFFTREDIQKIETAFSREMSYIAPSSQATSQSSFGRRKLQISLTGVRENYRDVSTIKLLHGRFLSKQDIDESRMVVLLNKDTALRLFGTENPVGKSYQGSFQNEMREFTVIGVYEMEVSPLQRLLQGPNRNGEGFLPWTVFPDGQDMFLIFYWKNGITKEQANSNNMKLQKMVARMQNRPYSDLMIQTVQNEMSRVDAMMSGLSMAVGGIAAISLLVGGIGIMNIMLVSVTERTREIGIRKALGAKTRDILVQFLTESALLSMLGGIIGILLSVGIMSLIGAVIHISVVIHPFVVLMAVGFSTVIGMFFGIFPARKAAMEDPIIALRYE